MRYQWTVQVREWVCVPPMGLGATTEQETPYLQQWRTRVLVEERANGECQAELERRWAREEEAEERRERASEERARQPAPQPSVDAARGIIPLRWPGAGAHRPPLRWPGAGGSSSTSPARGRTTTPRAARGKAMSFFNVQLSLSRL